MLSTSPIDALHIGNLSLIRLFVGNKDITYFSKWWRFCPQLYETGVEVYEIAWQ
jgi:hypothetical protein